MSYAQHSHRPKRTLRHVGFLLAELTCAVALASLTACAGSVYWKSAGSMTDLVSEPTIPIPTPLADAATLPRQSPNDPRSPYRLGVADELSVTMWGRPDLGSQLPDSGATRRNVTIVAADGRIHLPLIGPIQAEGKTLEEIRLELIRSYRPIVSQPQVVVDGVAYRSKSVRVLGEVRKPGLQFVSDTKRTVGDAIASAGGLSADADGSEGILVREGRRYRLRYRLGARGENPVLQVLLKDGDTIFFPKTAERIVYVFGETFKQGKVQIPDRGLTLLEALAEASGPIQLTASYNHFFLVRRLQDETEVYELAMKELLEGPDIAMQAGDRLFIPASRLTNWERFWRQVIPFFSSFAGLALSGAAFGF